MTTGPAGDFTYKIRKDESTYRIAVEASGFASRGFSFRFGGVAI